MDRATLSLIRRVLCSHAPPTQPLSDLLPPLTNHPAVDLELYALLAVVCRDYIDTWYTRITPDRSLTAEIVDLSRAVVAALEERIERIDIPLLLLDDLPALLTRHIDDYRLARARTGTISHHTHTELFHHLQPHPALAAGPSTQHQYNTLLSSAVLTALLPLPHLASPCARTFLRDLVSSLAVAGTIDRLSEPHTIHNLLTLLLRPQPPPPPPPPPPEKKGPGPTVRIPPALDAALATLWTLLLAAKTLLAALLATLHHPRPPREKPFLRMAAVRLLPVYLGVPALQPWLWGAGSLLLRPLTAGRVGAAVDAAVEDAVRGGVDSSVVARVLGRVRAALAPPGADGGDGGAPEAGEARARAVQAVMDRVPPAVWGVWFGGEGETRVRVAEWYVDVWEDKEVNMHLWYNVLDLLVARVFPELVRVGPSELLRERVARGGSAGCGVRGG